MECHLFLVIFFLYLNIDIHGADAEVIKLKLQAHDISFVALRDLPGTDGQQAAFFYCKTTTNVQLVIEIKLKKGMNVAKVTVKSSNKVMSEICKQAVVKYIS